MKRIGICFLLFFGCLLSLFAEEKSADSKAAFFHAEYQWIYPQKLGGMDYIKLEKYREKEFGYKVFYKKDDTFYANITVYNMGHDTIPDGCTNAVVLERFRGVKLELDRRVKQGQIKDLKEVGPIFVPKTGKRKFALTSFYYKMNEENIEKQKRYFRLIYLMGTKNNFFKVDFFFDYPRRKEAKEASQQLVRQLLHMMDSKPDDSQILQASYEALLYDPAGYGGKKAANYFFNKANPMLGLNIYTFIFVWDKSGSPPKNSPLIMAGYFAGMLKTILPKKLEEGGEVEAFTTMLKVYEVMRKKNDIVAIPELDRWVAAPDKKAVLIKLLAEQKLILPEEAKKAAKEAEKKAEMEAAKEAAKEAKKTGK